MLTVIIHEGSHIEGFGITYLEASAAGLPVVATVPDGPHAEIFRAIAARVRDQIAAGAGRAAPRIVIEA